MTILRLRGKSGQFRLEFNNINYNDLLLKISNLLNEQENKVDLYLDSNYITNFNESHLNQLKNGDILYFKIISNDSNSQNDLKELKDSKDLKDLTNDQKISLAARSIPLKELNIVDRVLNKEQGLIIRKRNTNFCKHNDSGMCDYCMPLDPWNESYLQENKIKHLSFHSYLRKLMKEQKTHPLDSLNYVPPLEINDISIKIPCPSKNHEPFPKGICTKCQPSSIILQSQPFRMVDHLEFENSNLVDDFLSNWRLNGDQRFGYLIGNYQPYNEVPLGCKAVVTSIYEPYQLDSFDGIQMELNDPGIEITRKIAKHLGNQEIVGMIYTDLNDSGKNDGSVICKRHINSYFLSSAEIIFSAQEQLLNRTKCRYSPTGLFGSRFITCVISGNEKGEIDISAYQVSNMAMEMVRIGLIDSTVEPSLMRVDKGNNEDSDNKNNDTNAFKVANNILDLNNNKVTNTEIPNNFKPEVSYKFQNKYKLTVQEVANPTFPVDYLLVNVTHGFPQTSKENNNGVIPKTFLTGFPIENRINNQSNTNNSSVILSYNDNKEEIKTFKNPELNNYAANYILNLIKNDKSKKNDIIKIDIKDEDEDEISKFNISQLSNLHDIHLLTYLSKINILDEKEFIKFIKIIHYSYILKQKQNNNNDEKENNFTSTIFNSLNHINNIKKEKGNKLSNNDENNKNDENEEDDENEDISKLLINGELDLANYPSILSLFKMLKLLSTSTTSTSSNKDKDNNGPVSSSINNNMDIDEDIDWQCPHCTFMNDGSNKNDCSMCGLPRNN